MRISYQWLQDFVEVDMLGVDVEEIASALTMLGLNVEEIQKSNDDSVFNVEVTTNRPDCLNHAGIAREIAAHYRLTSKSVDFSVPQSEGKQLPTLPSSVKIEKSDLCPRYAGRVMTDLKIKESPAWLKSRLEAVGQRPINNVVDITNYVMLELGHPLHAFDYRKLQENRVVVRPAKPGETLVTLDGVQRRLDPSMLMICDALHPVALAGIMGGEETEVSEQTQSVFLESAYFNPANIRSTSKSLGLSTEAAFRFERGADPEMPVKALNRACRLLQEIGGAVFAGPVIDEYPHPQSALKLRLRTERIRKLVGLSVDPEFITDVLERLEFELSPVEEGVWQVEVPSFRSDVKIEDDLVEEVVRHYGYDRIESTYPPAPGIGKFLTTRDHDRIMSRALQGLGFCEAFDYVFTSPSREAVFWNEAPSMVAISNPLTEEDTHLRISLLPGLVESLRRNLNHGNDDARLFEFGKVFIPGKSENREEIQETPRLALVATGSFYQPFWSSFGDRFDFHHLKGTVEVLLDGLGRRGEFKATSEVDFLHPGAGASIGVGSEFVGVMGELHPRVQEAYRFRQAVFAAELSLDPIYSRPLGEPRYRSVGRFPSVEGDLSFLVDNELEYAKILLTIEELKVSDLQEIKLIDLYQGPTLPQGKASLTIRLIFANPERTLTQDEVNRHTERIFSVLQTTFSVEGRS